VRRLLWGPVGVAAAALALLAALGAVATVVAPASRGVAAAVVVEVPVVETVVACPGLRSRKGFTESTVSAATPPRSDADPAAPAEEGAGLVTTLTRDPGKAEVLIQLDAPGDRGSYVGRSGERDSVVGRATESLAPGFSVTQTERTVDGGGRGLAGTACLPTGADFWFVGAASGIGQQAVIVLTNPEDATAAVDVTFYGRRGEINAPAGRGVQVPSRQRVELPVVKIAPAQQVLAIHVQVQAGRLSAAVTETDVEGFLPRGSDWIPGTEAPATDLVVPGVPKVGKGRAGKVLLDIVAPGEGAVVSLKIVAPDGTFAPLDADVVDVPGATVRTVDLTEALDGDPAAVLLSSDQPVTAGVRVMLRRPSYFGDTLFLAAVPPLGAAAVVPDNRDTADLSTRLVLTAPEGAATVEVSTFVGARIEAPVSVPLAAGTTTWLTVEAPKGRQRFGLVVTPQAGSGPVYGVRMLDEEGPRGPLVTSLPLRTARLTAVVPEAVPDIAAGTVD